MTIVGTSGEEHSLLLALTLSALCIGGLIVTMRHRALLRHVVVDPWREARAAGGLRNTLFRTFRLWPVAAMAVFSLLVWVLAFLVVA